MQGGVLPLNYSIAAVPLTAANGTVATCTVTLANYTPPNTVRATFSGISAGN